MNWKQMGTLGSSVKLRNDESDYDYLHKLNHKELNWLKGFHREYVNADFKHKYKRLFRTKKNIKMIYDRNNSRNRDLYGILKWTGDLLLSTEPCKNHNKNSFNLFMKY